MSVLLYLAFVLSGAAGLVYESVWSRYLGLFVGHSAFAQVIVIGIFLGGMALGAMLVGERSERLRAPLLWYAAAELVIGLLGFYFHELFVGVTRISYDAVFPALGGTALLVPVKWTIAAAMILPQSVLLGTTFPLMSAGVLRLAPQRPGRVLSLLYFANSIGAAAGVLLAGFYLLGRLGMPGTLIAAGAANLAVAALVFLIARRKAAAAAPAAPAGSVPAASPVDAAPAAAAAVAEPAPVAADVARLLLFVAFATAAASFIYEIAWIRLLSLVLGSASHSFELMLSAFIFGLAAGALWIHPRADRLRDPVRALALIQCLMGLAAIATLPLYLASFRWTAGLLTLVATTDAGYGVFNLARYALALVIMLPATFFAGMTLPLITRILLRTRHGERAIGRVYGLNTLGSIVGVALAGLVLLPWIGLKPLLVTGAVADIALGLLLFARAAKRPSLRLGFASIAGLVGVTSAVGFGTAFDPVILSSGVYRYRELPDPGTRQVLFYRDGRTATVAALRHETGKVTLVTNGKPDASLSSAWLAPDSAIRERRFLMTDDATQMLLALVTAAHRPDARAAAVIGHGSGMSSHFLLASPSLDRLATIEIEPAMVEGSRVLYPANRRVFDDPRSRLVIDDAKSVFASEPQRYDAILSEPSNPWVSGVAGLFTVEFYDRVRRYLAEGGVFGQWLHLYEIDDDLVLTVLAAVHSVFPHYRVYQVAATDILIVAGTSPLREPDWTVFEWPDVRPELARFHPFVPEHLDAARLLDRRALEPLLDAWVEPNSDYYPILELGAERTRFLGLQARGMLGLANDRFDIVAALAGRRRDFGSARIAPVPEIGRMRQLALGARLRAARHDPDASAAGDPELARPLHRLRRLEAFLASGLPPADWKLWLDDVVAVERDLHGGTAGVADEEFYAAVFRYLEDNHAPEPVRRALAFLHALARWDFQAASGAAAELLELEAGGERWLHPALLRDGTVVARLRLGDTEGAKEAFRLLAPRVGRPAEDLRERLLLAHLLAGGGAAAGEPQRVARPAPPLPGTGRGEAGPRPPTRSSAADD